MQHNKKILLVEDDKYIALALKMRLKAEGYDVEVANDRQEAMLAVSSQVPDVALIDYNLPDGNGIDVARLFSAQEGTAGVISIIMTASKAPGLREAAMAQGVADYFEKPFKSADLIASIESKGFKNSDTQPLNS